MTATNKLRALLVESGYTQSEIAENLGIGQGTVSKHINKIQQSLLEFDPEIKKILHLFKKTKKI